MSSIPNQVPDFLSFSPLAQNKEAVNKTQSSSATLQIQQSSEITLFTAEGDKVTLSSASSFEASYATYSSQGVIDGKAFQTRAEASSVSEAFAFKFSVEGDLNEKELKDITKALQTIEKLTSDFFSGKTDKALDRATRITNLDSIASFEAVLQYSKSLSAETAVKQTAPALPESSPQTLPIEKPVKAPEELPLPGVFPQAEATNDAPPVAGPLLTLTPSRPSESVKGLVEQMTDAVLESKIALSKIEKQVEAFLDSLFVKFARGDQMDLQELRLAKEVKTEFSFSIKAAASAEVESGEQASDAGASEGKNGKGPHIEVPHSES